MYENGQNSNPQDGFAGSNTQNGYGQNQGQSTGSAENGQGTSNYSNGYGAPGGQNSQTGYGTPGGQNSQTGYGAFGGQNSQTGYGASGGQGSPQMGSGGSWGSGPVPPYNTNWGQPPKPPKDHSGAKRFWGFVGKVAAGSLVASIVFTCVFGAATHIGLVKVTDVPEQQIERGTEDGGSGDFTPYFRNDPSFGDPNGENEGNGSNDGSGNEGNGSSDGSDNGDNGGNDGSGNGSETAPNGEAQQESDGPKLGITVENVSDEQIQEGYPQGILIRNVTKGSAADAAGLKEGDVITAFNGSTVSNSSSLASLIADCNYGKEYKLNYKRLTDGNWKAMSATVTFTEDSASDAS